MSIICSGSLFFMDFLTYPLSSLAVQLVHSKALLVPTLPQNKYSTPAIQGKWLFLPKEERTWTAGRKLPDWRFILPRDRFRFLVFSYSIRNQCIHQGFQTTINANGEHEAIIDKETFYKVQEILDGKRKKKPKLSKAINPDLYLRKFLIYPVCGYGT